MVWQNISTKTAGEGPPCYEKNMVLVATKMARHGPTSCQNTWFWSQLNSWRRSAFLWRTPVDRFWSPQIGWKCLRTLNRQFPRAHDLLYNKATAFKWLNCCWRYGPACSVFVWRSAVSFFVCFYDAVCAAFLPATCVLMLRLSAKRWMLMLMSRAC